MTQIKRRFINNFTLFLPAVALCYAALFLTILWRYPEGMHPEEWSRHLLFFSGVYVVWLFVFYGFRLFDAWSLRSLDRLFSALVSSTAINLVLAMGVFYLQPGLILTPRRFLLVHIAILFFGLFVWQIVMRRILRRRAQSVIYLLGSKTEGNQELLDETKGHPFYCFKLLSEKKLFEEEFCPEENMFIAYSSAHETKKELLSVLSSLHAKGVGFISNKRLYEETFRRIPLHGLNEWWFLENTRQRNFGLFLMMKRSIDLFVGCFIFLIFIVTYPIVALFIKFSSRGPVLFVQERAALHGKTFKIYKYRTMRADTDSHTWTSDKDPRITLTGQILRKTRIDELPQCLNLIKGDMSLVGPRPEQAHIVKALAEKIPYYTERHRVRPGITGWGQLHVYASSVEETRRKLQYDLYYIKHQSIFFDLEIMIKTLFHILFMEGK
jgi:exopolysaccharide biosynthesis polyprenyl glycosylphosphotransferase